MMILLSPAKMFARGGKGKPTMQTSEPHFMEASLPIVQGALALSKEELARQLHLSGKKADEAYRDWRSFISAESEAEPALSLYAGMVFKKIEAKTLSSEDWAWANSALRICSFVYGLLRPSDGIRAYRMEGSATLRWDEGQNVFAYWRDLLTPYLIEQVQAAGGTLIFLASEEMRSLFHWEQVEAAVRVITPRFFVRDLKGQLKQIVIYTKMARGAMARLIIQHRVEQADLIKGFEPEGFVYRSDLSSDSEWYYVQQG